MTAGYDEWALARTPSLLAFANALTDDVQRADAAVTKALARMRSSWHRVALDDPDLEARRLVVRACAAPRTAAVVLRVLEGRSDAEIAEGLRCSEARARRHLAAGTESGARQRLATRAGAAPTQLLARPPATDTEAPPRRRRGPGLAALATVLLVCGVAFVAHQSSTPDGVITYPKTHAPDDWRYESYAGVQLQVPDTWGWGSSPIRSTFFPGPRHLGSCGTDQALVLSSAGDSSYASAMTSFVGRPAKTTRACVSYGAAGSMPVAQAVWFASPLPVGVKSVGSTIAETRAVGGQRITVFSPQPSMRRKILGTAEQVDVDANGCPTRAVTTPTAGPAGLMPDSMSVCVYSQDTGVAELLYSARLASGNAQQYAALVGRAGAVRDRCGAPSGRWVALGEHDGDATRWDVADPGCAEIRRAGGSAVPMTDETVRDWAVGGVTAYLSPPRGERSLAEYFWAPTG
jgi:hypothetical protein